MKNLKPKWITKTAQTRLYQIPVPIIGLTGGIGSGKSSAAQIFREKNIPVIDADTLVKTIYAKHEAITFISKHFPDTIVNNNIVFSKLREVVFKDQNAKKLIEDFIYSYMPEEFKNAFSVFHNPSFIVYDVPLLFEKDLNQLVDVSICIYAPKETQIQRIISRDKSQVELAQKIIDSQMDIEVKKIRSDIVINNTTTLADLENLVEKFLRENTE